MSRVLLILTLWIAGTLSAGNDVHFSQLWASKNADSRNKASVPLVEVSSEGAGNRGYFHNLWVKANEYANSGSGLALSEHVPGDSVPMSIDTNRLLRLSIQLKVADFLVRKSKSIYQVELVVHNECKIYLLERSVEAVSSLCDRMQTSMPGEKAMENIANGVSKDVEENDDVIRDFYFEIYRRLNESRRLDSFMGRPASEWQVELSDMISRTMKRIGYNIN